MPASVDIAAGSGPAATPAKHELVANYLREQILDHKLPPRHMLESEAELCQRFNVSRGPVRQALSMLEQEQLIYRLPGRGSFVADRPQGRDAAAGSGNLWMMPIGDPNTQDFMLSPLLTGLEQGAREAGAALVVSSFNEGPDPHPLLEQGSVAGLFVCGPATRVIHASAFAHVPRVWLMTIRHTQQGEWDAVGPDNNAIGRLAADYLLGRDHRRLAFLNPMSADPSATDRMPGFITEARRQGATVEVLHDAAIDDVTPPTIAVQVRHERIEMLIDRLLALEPRPTGLFIPSDYMTAIVQPILQERGIAIGREMTIVSCNNDGRALAVTNPRPATIDLNSHQIGREAARIMAHRVAGLDFPWAIVLVPPVLIESPDEAG